MFELSLPITLGLFFVIKLVKCQEDFANNHLAEGLMSFLKF